MLYHEKALEEVDVSDPELFPFLKLSFTVAVMTCRKEIPDGLAVALGQWLPESWIGTAELWQLW